jgi:hypothetical protein
MIRRNAERLKFLQRKTTRKSHVTMAAANETFCPKCGAPACRADRFWGYGKPFCSACGWNADLARTIERRNLNQFPLLFSFVGLILSAIGASSAAYPKAFVSIMVATVAYTWFRSRRRLKAIENAQSDAAHRHALPSAVTQTHAREADTARNRIICDRIRALGKPRRTKLNTSSRFVCGVIVAMVLVALFALANMVDPTYSKPDTANAFMNSSSLLVFGLIVSAVGGVAIRAILRDRRLLQNGDAAVAVITSQMESGRDQDSYVSYEFEDAAGMVVTDDCKDSTRRLCKDMRMVVLYDPEDSNKSVTLANATVTLIDL